MNIVWQKPDAAVAVTRILPNVEVGDIREYAQLLLARGDIPADWRAVGFDIAIPSDKEFREAWRWTGVSLDIDIDAAREVTRQRLRHDRAPLLADLDMQFQRNLETGADNSTVVAEKNRLRDITKLPDSCATLAELRMLKC